MHTIFIYIRYDFFVCIQMHRSIIFMILICLRKCIEIFLEFSDDFYMMKKMHNISGVFYDLDA